ncbi:MAG: efflux RND transporter periplasmic adaptor subunit [Acidobacteriota bacterium]
MQKHSYTLFILILLIGAFLFGSFMGGGSRPDKNEAARGSSNSGERRILYYVDPMNPSHTSDKPGSAPCGMPLEPVYADEEHPAGDKAAMVPGTVKVNTHKQQLVGIQVDSVESASQTRSIRTLGRVSVNENRIYRVLSVGEGWVWNVRDGVTTGSLVESDQVLATFYNKAFFGAEQAYFFGLDFLNSLKEEKGEQSSPAEVPKPIPQAQTPPPETPALVYDELDTPSGLMDPNALVSVFEGQMESSSPQPGSPEPSHMQEEALPFNPKHQAFSTGTYSNYIADQARTAIDNLLDLGMSRTQIDELARTRKWTTDIEVRSPVAGYVISRNITPGQRFVNGEEFFRIADLSHVWIIADIFPGEAGYIRPGTRARISLPQQSETIQARVSEAKPVFDPASRTLKVRLDADNPRQILWPDMFVDVVFEIDLPPSISVPMDAVLDSGTRKTVFIAKDDGSFEPREVETGWRFNNRVQILGGLMPGERIVVSGNFLIDSESKMKLAAAGLHGSLKKDPVCGMMVSEDKAKSQGLSLEADGKPQYFCSPECKAQFEQKSGGHGAKPADATSDKAMPMMNMKEHDQCSMKAPDETAPGSVPQPAASASVPPGSEARPKTAGFAKDPVCGNIVIESRAKAEGLVSERDGEVHYFCRKQCKEQFDRASSENMNNTASTQVQHSGHGKSKHD